MSKVRLFGTMALGLVAGAGVGGLSVAAYLYITTEKPVTHTITKETTADEGGILSIEEHSVDGEFKLGDDGRKLLIERMKNDLGYGPEIASINKFVLAGMPAISQDSWGYYVPGANVMVINIDLMSQRVSGSQYKNELVELVMQTLYHEYQHHVASVYLNAVPTTHSSASDQIYENIYSNGQLVGRGVSSWLGSYIDDFKSALYYDVDTTKYSDVDLGFSPETTNDPHYQSLGALYDAEDLFEISNGSEFSYYDIETSINAKNLDGYIFGGTNVWETTGAFRRPYTTNKEANDQLTYLYSMDELYVRKIMQLKYVYDESKLSNHFTAGKPWGFYNALDANGIQSVDGVNTLGIWEDRTTYETTSDGWVTADRFLADAVFNGNQMDLVEAFDRSTGAGAGDDLSYVWYNNDVDINYDITDLRYVYSEESTKKVNNIKFGGYVDDETLTHVSYQDLDGNWSHIPITVNKYINGYKDSVDGTTITQTGADGYFYTTSAWTHSPNIEDMQLFFSKGINTSNNEPIDATPFVGARNSSQTGNAADWRGASPMNQYKNVFLTGFEDVDGSISIREWDIYG